MVPVTGPPIADIGSPVERPVANVQYQPPPQQRQQSLVSSPESTDNSLQTIRRPQVVAAPPVISDDSVSGLSQTFPTTLPTTAPIEKAKLSFAGILKSG